jgi:hypothetical protein
MTIVLTLFNTGDLPSTVEETKTLANDHLVHIVGQNMNYFIGKNGTVTLFYVIS